MYGTNRNLIYQTDLRLVNFGKSDKKSPIRQEINKEGCTDIKLIFFLVMPS